eukprot:SAG31_NODE_10940_length_1081_cov_0.882892_1_plen_270_part_10
MMYAPRKSGLSEKVLPLCRLYDAADGMMDGEASIFSTAFARCNEMPLPGLLQFLDILHAEGRCPDLALDGVAETDVQAPECQDHFAAGADGRCQMTIASGIFTCENDFCNTAHPQCAFAGQCDATCGLCGDGEGGQHRHLAAREPASPPPSNIAADERRALQMGHNLCNPATFTAHAAAVTEACCDGPGPYGPETKCASGYPASCDAKCAVAFPPFFIQCQRFFGQYSVSDMANYDQLFHTCNAALPTEPLLRAAIACTHPCAGVECGEH